MISLYVWAITGIIMILAELVLPGGVIIFLGLGCLTVAGGIWAGHITTMTTALLTFFISSLVYLLALRSLFIKYFEGDSSIQNTNEDLDSINSIVEVIEKITPYTAGRVRFRESTWVAESENEIQAGEKAIIKKRVGNKWIVSPLK